MKAKPSTRKAADPPTRKETQPEAATEINSSDSFYITGGITKQKTIEQESSEQQVQAPKKRTNEAATRPNAPAEGRPASPKRQPTPPDDTTSIVNI